MDIEINESTVKLAEHLLAVIKHGKGETVHYLEQELYKVTAAATAQRERYEQEPPRAPRPAPKPPQRQAPAPRGQSIPYESSLPDALRDGSKAPTNYHEDDETSDWPALPGQQ